MYVLTITGALIVSFDTHQVRLMNMCKPSRIILSNPALQRCTLVKSTIHSIGFCNASQPLHPIPKPTHLANMLGSSVPANRVGSPCQAGILRLMPAEIRMDAGRLPIRIHA